MGEVVVGGGGRRGAGSEARFEVDATPMVCHHLDAGSDEASIAQRSALLGSQNESATPASARPCRASDPVHIALRDVGQIEVDTCDMTSTSMPRAVSVATSTRVVPS